MVIFGIDPVFVRNTKKTVIGLVIVFSCFSSFSQNPNVILIITDDAGYADFGFTGSEEIKTPTIDGLASKGIVFSQAYVTASICAPSRAGIITGIYPQKFGFDFNLYDHPIPGYDLEDIGLDIAQLTIADLLKTNGYATAAFGKWHLGESSVHHPNNRGFDYFYGLLKGSRTYFANKGQAREKLLMRNHEIVEPDTGFVTDLLTSDAISWMNIITRSQDPFFMYLSYTAPHSPFESMPEDYEKVGECWFKGEICSEDRKNYVALMQNLDDNIGKLINELEVLNVLDNTVIFFINDNGGVYPDVVTDNFPYKGAKGSFKEGGIRVPFFISGLSEISEGTVYPYMVSSIDILPTIMNLTGTPIPEGLTIDGRNLMEAVQNPHEKLHEHVFAAKAWYWSMVISDNKKLVVQDFSSSTILDNDSLMFDLDVSLIENSDSDSYSAKDSTAQELLEHLSVWNGQRRLPHWLGQATVLKLEEEACQGYEYTDCPFLLDQYFCYYEMDNLQICDTDTLFIGDDLFVEGGRYYLVQSLNGCDSLYAFDLSVHATYSDTITADICLGDTLSIGEVDYFSQGLYTHFHNSSFGCDSLVTVDLTVHSTYLEQVDSTIFLKNGDYFLYGGDTLFESGYYFETLESSLGCDSIIQWNFILNNVHTSNSYEDKRFVTYPNPFDEEFEITFGGTFTGSILIYDLSGKLVSQSEVGINDNLVTLSVESLKKGIYQLVAAPEKGELSFQFIIKR